jgi:hypothetical protein
LACASSAGSRTKAAGWPRLIAAEESGLQSDAVSLGLDRFLASYLLPVQPPVLAELASLLLADAVLSDHPARHVKIAGNYFTGFDESASFQ